MGFLDRFNNSETQSIEVSKVCEDAINALTIIELHFNIVDNDTGGEINFENNPVSTIFLLLYGNYNYILRVARDGDTYLVGESIYDYIVYNLNLLVSRTENRSIKLILNKLILEAAGIKKYEIYMNRKSKR